MRAFRLLSTRLEPLVTAAVSPDELTRQLPRGFYSTFVTSGNGRRVLGLTAHLDRLYHPARELGLTPSASRADLQPVLARLAADGAPGETRFRLVLGTSDKTVYIIVQPFIPLPREIYEHGVQVVTTNLTRHDSRLKYTGFITESQSERGKVGGNIFEVLLTKAGKIYEGMTSNFYAVLPSVIARRPPGQSTAAQGAAEAGSPSLRRGTLVTARRGILLGVTRHAILRLARREGMDLLYRAPRLDEEFAEAFLTSSSRGVVPVIAIDSNRVGEGKPGLWTRRLSHAYQVYVEERSEIFV